MSKKQTPPPSPAQGELFKAEATWFHVFRSMVDSGDIAKMGTTAAAIYMVVKSYTNFSTGHSFPSIELIAEKSGLSTRQVIRELKTLESHGYLTIAKKGRHNIYTLREKIEIQDIEGRPAAVATFDYLPDMVKDATAELRRVLLTGDFHGAKIIQIQRLNMIVGDHNNQVVYEDALSHLEQLGEVKDPAMRARLLGMYKRLGVVDADKNQSDS